MHTRLFLIFWILCSYQIQSSSVSSITQYYDREKKLQTKVITLLKRTENELITNQSTKRDKLPLKIKKVNTHILSIKPIKKFYKKNSIKKTTQH